MDGGAGPDALDGRPAAVDVGQLLQVLRAGASRRPQPALNLRRPKVDYESRTLGLDRNELGAFLVQAGLGSACDHALASLLAFNGLRISEALNADIAGLDYARGHRTLKIVRKGGKHVTIPLAPHTSRALDLYIGERTVGPIFLRAKGGRMDRYAADRAVKRLAKRAGICKRISPHCLRHSFITAVMKAWRRVWGPPGLLIPALRANPAHDPPRRVSVEALAVPPEEDRALDPLPDGQVDGACRARGERDGDDLAALAQQREGAMAALDAESLDVGAECFRDTEPVDRQQGDEGVPAGPTPKPAATSSAPTSFRSSPVAPDS